MATDSETHWLLTGDELIELLGQMSEINTKLESELAAKTRALEQLRNRDLVLPNNRTKEQIREEASSFIRFNRAIAQAALKGEDG